MFDAMTPEDWSSPLAAETLVHIVEDDLDLCDALACLLNSAQLPFRLYQTPDQILKTAHLFEGGALVIDARLPGIPVIDLVKELRRREIRFPIVVMSADADVRVTIQAFKLGVLDFLVKPFAAGEFLDAVRHALAHDVERRNTEAKQRQVQSRLDRLTKKDWQVIELLRLGHPNKRIAATLGISERAVEMRRSALLKKTQATGWPELFELIALSRPDRDKRAAKPGSIRSAAR